MPLIDTRRLAKLFRRTFERLEFDSEKMLHRAGLTRYRPVKQALGAVGLLALGGAIGTAISLMLTPRTGPEFRKLLSEKASGVSPKARDFPRPEAELRV